MDEHGSLDFGHVLGRGLTAVERNSRSQVRRVDRHLVGDGPAPAETHATHLARGLRLGLEIRHRGHEILRVRFSVELLEERPSLVWIRRGSSLR